ncbi:MAG TPA: hypothetical protein VJ203_01600 [Bacteroidales bacterium]|nr:hypothetical protein [Bacteroidales bacterium]
MNRPSSFNKKRSGYILTGLILIGISCCGNINSQDNDRKNLRLERKAIRLFQDLSGLFEGWQHTGVIGLDSIRVDYREHTVGLYFSPTLTHLPIRNGWLLQLESKIGKQLGKPFQQYGIQLFARGRKLEEYIPNYFRDSTLLPDESRNSKPFAGPAWVTNTSRPVFSSGLSGNHIALWPSHGYFYDQAQDRWRWQRARLYGTVEDIFPFSFVVSYLAPMLENAGATVIIPRERDTQVHEVVVDNDTIQGASRLEIVNGKNSWEKSVKGGFLPRDTIFTGENPFVMGSYLKIACMPDDTAKLKYIPEIPESGDYAVYVSWGSEENNRDDVRCDVNHSGGTNRFLLNQTMGAATWAYLGTFHFHRGLDPDKGSVIVYGSGTEGSITADAVRFGGGMGNIARKPGNGFRYRTSGRPRWMEGSRYFLQYAGMPDTIVYTLNKGQNDYNDDYMSRGEWINYLVGSPSGPTKNPGEKGLNLPVELALAFHTDAGVTWNDSVIGTLGIYSTFKNNGIFPSGRSQMASRDLTDIIQSQIVSDIGVLFDPEWTRRAIWDKQYSEAWRPNVPAMLLELLSHQNIADMQYGLDPRFKFAASRAIYKGMARFLAGQEGRDAIIQPLPPDHMAIESLEGLGIRISWSPVADPLEPSSFPTGFMVYRQEEDNGFADGKYTTDTSMIIALDNWQTLYSFRVTALNSGGESFPGEVVSVALFSSQGSPVLIVNAFDRICGPAVFDKGDMAGIAWWEDEGVSRGMDHSHTGKQYDFSRNSDWKHDDSQGWGASFADQEGQYLAGNSFDFPRVHGRALRDAGYSFVSVSDEVFESGSFPVSRYRMVDLIFGEERGTADFRDTSVIQYRLFTPGMMNSLIRFAKSGGNIFISGAYVGTDMVENQDSAAIRFAGETLHFSWRSNHATNLGYVYATGLAEKYFCPQLRFNTGSSPELYRVESPDAIEPAGEDAFCIYRYTYGTSSAATAYRGPWRVIVLGFPFETIDSHEQRVTFMRQVMDFFEK